MARRRHGGFTLIELLTVFAVTALLAAILLPVFAETRERGRRATCLSNLRQLVLAHQIYVQDHDDILPHWYYRMGQDYVIWPEFMRPYYRDLRLLDQGFATPVERNKASWLADYVLCAWGSGGRGSANDPYWRWPGAPSDGPAAQRPMALAEVRRPAETIQLADGFTGRSHSFLRWHHRNRVLQGAFLDGHVRLVSMADWWRVDRDAWGYFYTIAAADR